MDGVPFSRAWVDRVVDGLERRSQVPSEQERRMVADHEFGHAFVDWFAEHSDPVHRVSLTLREIGALGTPSSCSEVDRHLISEPLELSHLHAYL